MIEIIEVKTQAQRREFVNFPNRLYRNDPNFMPQLKMDEMDFMLEKKNVALRMFPAIFFLARKDGTTAGRIMGLINHESNLAAGTKRVRFNKFDVIDDIYVTRALMDAVCEWGRQQGMEEIHGPLGFNDMEPEGMLTEGFDELPSFITIYNYPYYPKHMEELGFEPDARWVESLITIPDKPDPRIKHIIDIIKQRKPCKLIHFNKTKEIFPYLDEFFSLYNDKYEHLYAATRLASEQIEDIKKKFIPFINPHFVKLILDEQDKLIAFGLAVPSLTKALKKSKGRLFPTGILHMLHALHYNDRLDLYIIGVRDDYINSGIVALILDAFLSEAVEHGYRWAETGPELVTNTKIQSVWKFFEKRQHKKRAVYLKKL